MPIQLSDRNAFLAELSAADYELFRPHLTSLNLSAGDRLQNIGMMIEQVVFPHAGLVALTMPLQSGGGGGAILVGRDGILGALEAAAAAPAMCDAEVCIDGQAAHISASAFHYLLDQSPIIRRLVGRHNAALMVQAHQTALCNAAHPVEARVSRLLLEAKDRIGDIDVPLTQTRLSQMLGVQRTTVNQATGKLEKTGLINCRRGYIRILRREQLERHACECYGNLKSYV
jgi:CRP-like cAMP-binding protein